MYRYGLEQRNRIYTDHFKPKSYIKICVKSVNYFKDVKRNTHIKAVVFFICPDRPVTCSPAVIQEVRLFYVIYMYIKNVFIVTE